MKKRWIVDGTISEVVASLINRMLSTLWKYNDNKTENTLNVRSVQIQATQVNNPLKTAVARVEVELLDINDNKPQFEVDLYNISIVENLPNGFSVLQVMATDQDQVYYPQT